MSTILISSLFETIDESQYDYRSSSLQSLGLQDFQTSIFGNSSVEALGLQGYRVWGLGLRVSTHTLEHGFAVQTNTRETARLTSTTSKQQPNQPKLGFRF